MGRNTLTKWQESNIHAEQYGKEIARQVEEKVQQELDELVEPMDAVNLRRFWIHFTDYFESKYFT